mmetsp:Transcript_12537/g.39836  ORF Transcript_12537/g.39836 Transcript_12537/m.39836 type:complete len:223 (-) Transcript_12537:210-878(-)
MHSLYAAGFPGRTARTGDPRHPRLLAQAEFINHYFPHLSKSALVVEIGCSYGNLLRKLALRTRTLVCFEPTPAAARAAGATLRNNTEATVHIFNSLWDPALLRQAVGDHMIDLLVSSHVMEHLADLCQFSRDLGPIIASDGIVFAEALSHTAPRISAALRHSRTRASCLSSAFWSSVALRSTSPTRSGGSLVAPFSSMCMISPGLMSIPHTSLTGTWIACTD